MARKWRAFFRAVQSILNRSGKFILIGVLAIAVTLNWQAFSPAIAREPSLNLNGDLASADLFLDENRLNPGIELYKNGRFAEAEASFQEAARFLSGDVKALVLNYIALAQLRQSEFERAEINLQESRRLLNEGQNLGDLVQKQKVFAQILTTYGRLKLAQNQLEAALDSLAKATKIYEELGDTQGKLGSQINEAQAMQQLGLYRDALQILASLEEEIKTHTDPEIRLRGILTLGKTYRAIGALEKSYCLLSQDDESSEVLLERGNTSQAIGKRLEDQLGSLRDKSEDIFFLQSSDDDECKIPTLDTRIPSNWYEEASTAYQKALSSTPSDSTKVQAMLNELSLALYLKQYPELEPEKYETKAKQLWPQILEPLEELQPNRMKVYDRIKLARNLTQLYPNPNAVETATIEKLFETALQEAQELQDKRAEAYAIGDRGWMYEQQQQWQEAETWTRKAMEIPLPYATDIAYQWEWQLGRILNAEGRKEEAIAHYTEAVDLLQKVRQNLVAIAEGIDSVSADLQFDFRDRVEPVYRQLLGLLLEDRQPSQQKLKKARDIILSFQEAELESFFICDLNLKDNRVTVEEFIKNKQDNSVAIIYPIDLDNKMGIIAKMPDLDFQNDSLIYGEGRYDLEPGEVNQNLLGEIIKNFNRELQKANNEPRIRPFAKTLYKLIIEPIEDELQQSGVKTLVFVPDSQLRNIPFSALYNREYLLQKYAVAISTGWEIERSKPWQEIRPNALIAGLPNPPQDSGYPALPGVTEEVTDVSNILDDAPVLLDQDFTINKFKEELTRTPYNLVHIATHGQFSSIPENTFILTAPAVEVDARELNKLLVNRSNSVFNTLELLVLSACETAKADNRAALGLAGIAVKSGAGSILASLWSLKDKSTANFIVDFYKTLVDDKNITKAEALQMIQIKQIENSIDSREWSPYILLGNWY
ncbi:CHAT domain-containing tetratricopeptide repeat protein [Laspinema olomoucense]|uniref:CHAT domain-containing tetratricopeptide repeat protein n=1 Tax=Laspinema olomoucense TaxID=3231600 RepID=UPI0021BB8225|nr:CHAT domain-containing protein [Laspinema sp. D3c]MCT7997565.1 CHAT domain-containing protein [Laspinema sp. D3c]